VVGVGTVRLSVRRNPNNPDVAKEIVLTGVLHIPDLMNYNIIRHERLKYAYNTQLVITWGGVAGAPGFPFGRVVNPPNGGAVFVCFSWSTKKFTDQELRHLDPKPCCVAMAGAPRGCTFSKSTFAGKITNAQSWIRGVSLLADDEERLNQLLDDLYEGAWRPYTQVAQ